MTNATQAAPGTNSEGTTPVVNAEGTTTPQQLTPEQQAATDKAAADKTAADKLAAERAAMTPEQRAAAEAADKEATDKATKDAADKAKNENAPEKYETFKAPEGVALNAVVMTEFQAVAKELNLSQAKAQTLLDKLGPQIAQAQTQQIDASVKQVQAEWVEVTKADSEIGGEKLAENLATANKALEMFGTKEFKALLDQTRLGDHPEFIRAFYRVGKAISQDGTVVTGQGAPVKSGAAAMYPNSNHK